MRPAWGDVLSAAIAVGVASGLLEAGDPLRPGPRAAGRQLEHPDDQPARRLDDPGDGGGTRSCCWRCILVAPLLILAARRVRKRPEDDVPGPGLGLGRDGAGHPAAARPAAGGQGLPSDGAAGGLGRRGLPDPSLDRPAHVALAAEDPRCRGDRDRCAGPADALAVARGHLDRTARGGEARPPAAQPPLDRPGYAPRRPDEPLWLCSVRPLPRLEAWAKAGITFDMARSTAPWTLPSHVSMFTGLLPSEHGACIDQPYRGSSPTLAEHLRARGTTRRASSPTCGCATRRTAWAAGSTTTSTIRGGTTSASRRR